MPVNVENINKTIARIRQNQNFKFNMKDWGGSGQINRDNDGHFCGTSACIAGFAVLAEGEVPLQKKEVWDYTTGETLVVDALNTFGFTVDISQKAREYLGLDEETAHRLFMPDRASVFSYKTHVWTDGPNFFSATENQAIAVLEHLRDTGELDWSKSGIQPEDEGFFDAWKAYHGYDYTELAEHNA